MSVKGEHGSGREVIYENLQLPLATGHLGLPSKIASLPSPHPSHLPWVYGSTHERAFRGISEGKVEKAPKE